jgi:hypothetical protein
VEWERVKRKFSSERNLLAAGQSSSCSDLERFSKNIYEITVH